MASNVAPLVVAGPGATYYDVPVPHGAVLVPSAQNVSLDGIMFVPEGGPAPVPASAALD